MMTECSSAHEEYEKIGVSYKLKCVLLNWWCIHVLYVVSTKLFQIFKYINILTNQMWMLPIVFELFKQIGNHFGKPIHKT